jgi:hypothetical protein
MSRPDHAPAQPLKLIYDAKYDYVGNWGFASYCWLRAYVPERPSDLPVVVMSQMPDNPGTSITNRAEQLTYKIQHDAAVWAKAPNAAREGCFWVQHYPEHDDHFSIVTFAYDRVTEAAADDLGTVTMLTLDGDPSDNEQLAVEYEATLSSTEKQGVLGKPEWEEVSRLRVERMIGQPYLPIPPTAN